MLLLSLLLLSYCYILWMWRNRRYIRLYWKIGSKYPSLPFLGHGYLYMRNKEQVLKNLFSVGDHALSNGGLSTTWMLQHFYLVLADPVDAEYVLKYHLEKDDLIKYIRFFTRTSSVFSAVPIWRPRRKIVTTLLSHKNVSKFGPAFAKGSEILVEQLRPRAGRGAFSIWEYFNAYTVDTTCSTILGIDLKSQLNHADPLRTAINGVMDLAADFVVQIWHHINLFAQRSSFYEQFHKHDQVVRLYVDKAIKQIPDESQSDSPDDGEQVSLLQLFAQLKRRLGFEHSTVYDESLGLLMAGSDTTAVAAALVATVLAARPHVQDKVYREVREVFGESDRPMSSEDLPRLRYLEAVIRETLRLLPPAPHITRKALVDIVLPSGVAVPKGTNFLVSIYALNRNPKYWGADAEQFRPERFLDGSAPAQTAFFAFSHGTRGCPGVQFALRSLKTALSAMLRRYRLLPAGDCLRLQFGVTVKDVDNFPVRILPRTD